MKTPNRDFIVMSSQESSHSSSPSGSAGVSKAAPSPSLSLPSTSPKRSPDHSSSSPRTPSPLNPRSQSQSPSPTPPSRTTLLPTPPTVGRVRLHSFDGRDPSPVRDALIPLSRVTSAPAVPQSSAAASSSTLPAIVLGSTIVPPSLFRSRSPSRARSQGTSPERGHEPDNGDFTAPSSTWWSHQIHPLRPWAEPSKRKRTVPPEQVEGYLHTRSVRQRVHAYFNSCVR